MSRATLHLNDLLSANLTQIEDVTQTKTKKYVVTSEVTDKIEVM